MRRPRSKVRFVETKQSSSSAAGIQLDKPQCFFPKAPPKCCSSSAAMTSLKECPTISQFAYRRSRTLKFFIEQKFGSSPVTKSFRKLNWKTRAQARGGQSKRRRFFQ